MNVLNQAQGNNWMLYQGDCVQVMKGLPDNSIDLTVTSPPFGQLYIYSDSEADMGNSSDDAQFMEHFRFAIRELWNKTVPGRLCVIHCKDLPSFMNRDGAMGLTDFPGEIIRAFEQPFYAPDAKPGDKPELNYIDDDGKLVGWKFHSRVTIWKDPVIEMERTNNNGLLYKNFRTGSEACRQGMADYLIVFRKWSKGDTKPVRQEEWRDVGDYVGTDEPQPWEYRPGRRDAKYNHNLAVWQRYASPVWFDINQMNVLNYQVTKDPADERHICPLQLDVIERCIDLWSNPGDVVFTPFAGIGSEVVSAVKMKRKGVGVELKSNYFNWGVKFCEQAEAKAAQPTLWDFLETEPV